VTESPEKSSEGIWVGTVFTTHKKPRPKTTINILRKGSIVKERCKQLAENALNLFPDRVLSDQDVTDLIFRYIGADKETIRNYKGYYGSIRPGKCGDNKIVGLSRKGYLELYDFFTRQGSRWIVHAQSVLSSGSFSSQAIRKSDIKNESNEKISISSRVRSSVDLESGKVVTDVSSRREEEEATEKDRFFTPKISPKSFEEDPNKPRNLSPMIGPKIEDEQRNLGPKILPMISGDNDPNLAYLKLLAKAKPTEGRPS
jgi:hypothetical protein